LLSLGCLYGAALLRAVEEMDGRGNTRKWKGREELNSNYLSYLVEEQRDKIVLRTLSLTTTVYS
jgi:hypothetical protein